MRKVFYYLTALAGLAMAASCTLNKLEQPVSVPGGSESTEVILTATAADGYGTKTTLSEDGLQVLWNPGDEILVYRKDWAWSNFYAQTEEPSARTQFAGSIYSSAGNIDQDERMIWALSPAPKIFELPEEKASVDYMPATLPFSQTARETNFDPRALLLLARSASRDLAFYHVGGGVKFKLTQDWIQQVELRANNDAVLAGSVQLVMDEEGHPMILKVEDGDSFVTLTVPKGEHFKTDTWYYICTLPAVLDQGFTLTFRSEDKTGVANHPNPVEIKRAVWGVLDAVDEGVVPEDDQNSLWNEIYYTTTDDQELKPNNTSSLEANIVSNEYKDGLGVITFDGPINTIPSGFMNNATRLKTISLPSTVKTLKSSAFNVCNNLTQVEMSKNVKAIENSVFYGCSNLATIALPESLKAIGAQAFAYCNLTEVAIPGSLETVEPNAFDGNNNLTTFTGPLASSDGRCLVIDNALVYFAKGGQTEDYNYTIPAEDGITRLADRVFQYSSHLTEITLPDSLEEIGEEVFLFNNQMTAFHGKFASQDGHLLVVGDKLVAAINAASITIPGAVKSIATRTLYNLGALQTLTLEEGVEEIGDYNFSSCYNLQVVTLPNSLKVIGKSVFQNDYNLQAFHGKFASEDGHFLITDEGELFAVAVSGLTAVEVPATVTKIGARAFYNLDALTSITLPDGLTEIGEEAFADCGGLTEMSFPSSLGSIGNNAFRYCSSLTSVTLSSGLRTIGNNAFYYCPKLTDITFAEGLTEIGDNAFWRCTALTEVALPSSLRTIGNYAFRNTGLTSFTMPAGVTLSGIYIVDSCPLTSITLLPTTPPALKGTYTYPLGYNINGAPIYVPAASLKKYQNAEAWWWHNYQAIAE